MLNVRGYNLHLKKLRDLLNPDIISDDIEYLYGHDDEGDRRWSNLVAYLRFMKLENPEIMLIGEAPGYRGTSVTGIPFLSEGTIKYRLSNSLLLPVAEYKWSRRYEESGFEATSNCVWQVLDSASLPKLPIMWAVLPNHPHVAGKLMTNRKPTKNEINHYIEVTNLLIEMYNITHVVAIGNVAHEVLSCTLSRPIIKLRHPARGGSKKFKEGFNNLAEGIYGRKPKSI